MSLNDDFEDELHRIAERRKSAKPNRIKIFFKRNKWKILVAGLVTAFLMYASSIPNVGYTGTVEADKSSAKILVEHHPCYGYILNGYVNISFNPFLYPISHLTGQGKTLGDFVRWSGSTYPAPQDPVSAAARVSESLTIQIWFSELVRNLPYMSFIGGITAFGIGRFFENIKSRFRKSAP